MNFFSISSAKVGIGGDCAPVRPLNWLTLLDVRKKNALEALK